ncbi:MAG TPA: hypothetical protein DEP05_03830 [Betaproteobacteria bacterium]|nr:hypothetical protein [Betaproteobacteria bacterium]
MIQNADVGFVHPGQHAKIKRAAYPFQKYGMLDGTVMRVSADASEAPLPRQSQNGSKPQIPSIDKAVIRLSAQQLRVDGIKFGLTSEMQIVAEIKQGRRTILEYLLSPIQAAFHEAGRER